MRKYKAVFVAMWQNSIEYRVNFFIGILIAIISLTVLIFIWSAVFKQTGNFGGYTLSTMITYLIMARFLRMVTRGNVARLMSDEIKEGKISRYLLKPINYLGWWFSAFLAERIFEAFLRLFLLVFLLFVLPQYFVVSSPSRIVLFLIFLPISLMINFIYSILIANCAFYVTDTRLFRNTLGLAMSFLAGELMPLDILPDAVKSISLFLPFQYLLYFPIKILQGSLSNTEIVLGTVKALTWLFIFMILSVFLWKKGLKKYESIGQ